VAGLLEAGLEEQRQPIDIVAEGAGRGAKAAIGHQHRAGGIVGQPDGDQLAGDLAAQPRAIGKRADHRAERGCGNMIGDLETDARRALARLDLQHTLFGIEAAQHLGRTDLDRDALDLHQMVLQGHGGRHRIRPGDQPHQPFGGAIKRIDIIVRQVEPVAHLLPRQPGALVGAGGERLIDHFQPLAHPPERRVELNKTPRESRVLPARRAIASGGRGHQTAGRSPPRAARAKAARHPRRQTPASRAGTASQSVR
jgi:hypothetical protein